MCNLFKRKPKPSMINLEEYQDNLEKWAIPLPPPPPPGAEWTNEEMEMMKKNRKVAQILYEHSRKHDRN